MTSQGSRDAQRNMGGVIVTPCGQLAGDVLRDPASGPQPLPLTLPDDITVRRCPHPPPRHRRHRRRGRPRLHAADTASAGRHTNPHDAPPGATSLHHEAQQQIYPRRGPGHAAGAAGLRPGHHRDFEGIRRGRRRVPGGPRRHRGATRWRRLRTPRWIAPAPPVRRRTVSLAGAQYVDDLRRAEGLRARLSAAGAIWA